ncbi:MAG: DnaD domain protein [Clostridia bacterium]|nr:DnaD domain protein [Clostridia bacterium]
MFEMDQDATAYGVTAIENRFLMDYLPAAKGDFVKVYLWGLFACAHKGSDYSLEEMAQELFLTVPEIEAALRYWERRGLVCRVSDHPVQYRFYSPAQRQQSAGAPMQASSEQVDFAEAVYAIFSDRRKVNPAEIALAWEWVQDIGLQPEVVLMLLSHCAAQRGTQFSFKKAEPLAVRMKEANVVTSDDADAFLRHQQAVHDGTRKVLSRMGKRRLPSDDELALYQKWLDEWGYEPQAILDACKETTSGDPSFKYLDGILNGLRTRGEGRSAQQVQQQLAQEKDERRLAQEVFHRLGVTLDTPAALRLYREFTALQPHAVLLLAADECSRTKRSAKAEDMLSLLESWKSKGLTTEEEVQAYLEAFREANSALREIFTACGHHGRPTAADRALYQKWRGMLGHDVILFAAEQARAAEGSKIAYLDKVIENWHEAGITDLSQVKAQKKPTGKKGGKTVSAQQYAQRDYTEDELNAISGDMIEEARQHRE